MLIVKKFGGTSVGNTERIKNVANRIAKEYCAGNDVIVVLSAMDQTTDELLDLAKELNANPPKREMDALLSTGEQTSVALMAMTLAGMGIPAISLNAFQVAMHTTAIHSNARLKSIDTERIEHELESKKVILVTGFQGLNKYGDVTTIGRGGSDTTAVAIAAAMHADSCEIYTDVDGVYTADPRLVEGARKVEQITYDEMLELASMGAQVLHNRSVELAKKYGVELVVRSSLNENEGTVIKEVVNVESMLISGVAGDKKSARVTVTGISDIPGSAYNILNILANNSINIEEIHQMAAKDGKEDVSLIMSKENVDDTVALLEKHLKKLGADGVDVDREIARVSIVGASVQGNPGVAATMFEALYKAGINVKMIGTSEMRITVYIEEEEMNKAVKAVHAALIG
ncbi:MAG: aspartate kinase [Lachnospiraceae bacterium]|nr:aspartate kinase [Lachnospiraceae bacterium]